MHEAQKYNLIIYVSIQAKTSLSPQTKMFIIFCSDIKSGDII